MPKVNVYVPDNLLADVRAAGISVSGVCQDALEIEVRRRAAVAAAGRDLRAVAARLIDTQAELDRRDYADGLAFGTRWARVLATLAELEVVDRAAGRGWQVDLTRVPTMVTAFFDENPDRDPDPEGWVDGEHSRFDRGVLAGAAEVYRAVRPLIEAAQRAVPRQKALERGSTTKATASPSVSKPRKVRAGG